MNSTDAGWKKITGFQRGIVKAHSDFGRCKIFWPAVMHREWNDDDKIDSLPDAEQATSLFMFGSSNSSNNGNGVFSYPEIGSIVWGFFENGDPNHPVYFAGTMMANDENNNVYGLIKNKQESIFNLQTDNGTLTVTINDDTSWVSISQKKSAESNEKDASITLFKDGGITIDAPNADVRINARNIVLNASNAITILSQNMTNVDSFGTTSVMATGHARFIGRKGAFVSGSKDNKSYT